MEVAKLKNFLVYETKYVPFESLACLDTKTTMAMFNNAICIEFYSQKFSGSEEGTKFHQEYSRFLQANVQNLYSARYDKEYGTLTFYFSDSDDLKKFKNNLIMIWKLKQ